VFGANNLLKMVLGHKFNNQTNPTLLQKTMFDPKKPFIMVFGDNLKNETNLRWLHL
jgi:hypothetical protein